MSDKIKVVVKVRPLISREIEDKLGYQWRVNNNTLFQLDQNGRDCGPCFTFDKVYDKDTKTSDVYKDIAKPIVEAATAGFNGTIFAYGQTSSGKTYTMTGTKEAPGIIPLAVINLYDIIKNIPDRDFLVRVSYVEIYNESLTDLLDLKKQIKICETLQGVKVDATEKVTTSPEEVLEIMRLGKANRQTGATNMNEESSRSHSIFQITIESREHIEGEEEVGSVNVSQLNLVDLAGSERSGQTGATGLRFKEGTHINKSLSALALVIKQLSEDPNKHVNYRDSKLTRMLQNSLGGNAKTSIICAVTPAAVEETISTLQFANRAKAIKNNPAVNAVATNATMIQSLTKQLSQLKTQLESKKNVEQDNYNLQKHIGALQRLILNGFSQRSNTELSGARRKLIQPRRVTISTLHPIQEDSVPAVPVIPKFCTPSLKYNPMSLANTTDFVPIANALSLPSVSEEPRLITPPPHDKKVNFHDEIIELDSDDDSTSDVQTCSPYHKCYQSSKTPPCVLRKSAKQAEKNLKDIVELTEREKLYSPDITELMEKVESKSKTITKLEEKLTELDKLSKEKDSEMEKLQSNIEKMHDEIKNVTSAKVDLEETCKNYNTKLTDWEFSYETLKKKAKMREDELLYLLREHEIKKKHEKIGKIASKAIEQELNFMDISLVSSDNENSIINIEQTQSMEVLPLMTDLQSELSLKDQTIAELKSALHTHKSKIDTLEILNNELQEMISNHKEEISLIKNENSRHKSTIDGLNSIIESQKTAMDTLDADIRSYNSVIQELQIKLAQKDKLPHVNDKDIEAMIENEQMLIANNENIKNIVHSFKNALNLKNDEIKRLKSSVEKDDEATKTNIMEKLETKKQKISELLQELEHLKVQSTENISVIDKLLKEKKHLLTIEQQCENKLTVIQKEKEVLTEQITNHMVKIKNLKESNEKIAFNLEERALEIVSLKAINEEEITTISQKILDLEENIKLKDEMIASLKESDNETQKNIHKIKSNLQRLNKIMELFAGNILEVPEKINDIVAALSMLNDSLTTLENLALDSVTQKNEVVALLEKKETEIKLIESYLNDLGTDIDCFYEEYESLKHIYSREILSTDEKDNVRDNLKNKIRNLMNTIKLTQIHFKETLLGKEMEVCDINLKYENKQKELEEEAAKVKLYKRQLLESSEKRDQLLQNILERVTILTSVCNIENSISCQFNSNPENMYEKIILTIDKLSNHITILESKRETDYGNIEGILSDARDEIKQLTEENIKLIQDISNLESNNDVLSTEIKRAQDDSKSLSQYLIDSHNLQEQLRQHLTEKSNEIDNLEAKTIEWKDKFRDLEIIMNKQIDTLETENIELKSKCLELEMQEKEKPKTDLKEYSRITSEHISPPSLITICCSTILDAISLNENDKTASSASSTIEIKDNGNQLCKCIDLKADLDILRAKNLKLISRIEELESENVNLVKEQEEVQNEVRLLIESTNELQKKIINHRTNLSTLTATTYAENKLLSSQVKFLQHHHSRFHNVCLRDIPDFKKQLQDLLVLLKSETIGKLNESFKRYSLPNALETISLHSSFKNESTIDGDLLMLDTNVTLTTCDNTLTHDQTCFDATQICTYEVACQTQPIEISKNNLSYPQIKIQSLDETKILETIKSLKIENGKLREVVDEYNRNKERKTVEGQYNNNNKLKCTNNAVPINNNEGKAFCKSCENIDEIRAREVSYKEEIKTMTIKLAKVEAQKHDIELKYQNLSLEIPSTDILVRKLSALEKDNGRMQNEIETLNYSLNKKREELKTLQEENDLLSNQIIESISEVDDLKKEHDSLKEINNEVTDKFSQLQQEVDRLKCNDISENDKMCAECILKDQIIHNLESKLTNSHPKLDRSYSESDSSSRYNKICSLQNELHAGKEDCIELKEQVTTIKNHLERSDLSIDHAMDLDESIGDSHICSFNQDFENSKTKSTKCNMPGIPEEHPQDAYTLDKIECLNYFSEKTGTDKGNINCDIKIVEIMKILYDNIANKHANEIENFLNNLRNLEDSKTEIQEELNKLYLEHAKITKELEEKDSYLVTMANVVSEVRNNIQVLKESNDSGDIIASFEETFLKKIDNEFGFESNVVFQLVVQHINHKNEDLSISVTKLDTEIDSLNKNLLKAKSILSEKENEFNLLQRQKEKIHEISTVVTLDIVKKERELRERVIENYEKLLKNKILLKNIDVTLPTMEILKLLFDNIITNHKHKNNDQVEMNNSILILEVDKLKTIIEVKEKELQLMTNDFDTIQSVNKNMVLNLSEKENKLEQLASLHNELTKIYETKEQENDTNIRAIKTLSDESSILKATVSEKENIIASLQCKLNAEDTGLKQNEAKVTELLKSHESLQHEILNLKSINDVILKEKETCLIELKKAQEIINQNKIDFSKLTSDILNLKETVKDSTNITENLRLESKRLLEENGLLKNELQENRKNVSRLNENIKKLEKTVEIQSGIIIRLKKQKQDDESVHIEKENQITQLTDSCKLLEKQIANLKTELQSSKEETEELRNCKRILETRISELASEIERKPRLSVDIDTSRRRRQSIQDSNRLFSDDVDEHKKMEAMFKTNDKADDLFMEVDYDSSNRSTPLRLSRGRDSLLSKHEQSGEETRPDGARTSRPDSAQASRPDSAQASRPDSAQASRPDSVQASRRRRHSALDLRRHVRAGHDNSDESSRNNSIDGDVTQLKKQLAYCQQELEDLKVKYKEVDEECEICAEYLRERDEQCLQLKKEKRALENTLADLKEKLKYNNPNYSQTNGKNTLVDASVNTDEDWANLHSVVVDRMSYDAEVEKNKKLIKTIEELRFKKHDLKKNMAKMQRALEKNTVKDSSKELESTKEELSACKQELQELREKYRELDNECETCAEYLRERDEQCRKLKEAKTALEIKLQEYQDLSSITHSVRKKRQSLHDKNRRSPAALADAATETSDDFLSYHVEKDEGSRNIADDKQAKEMRRLKMAVEKLSHQKSVLEQQLLTAAATPLYVATGSAIVQNQQLTDVMKENQKLKKINSKLITICKKRGKSLTDSNRENEDPLNN